MFGSRVGLCCQKDSKTSKVIRVATTFFILSSSVLQSLRPTSSQDRMYTSPKPEPETIDSKATMTSLWTLSWKPLRALAVRGRLLAGAKMRTADWFGYGLKSACTLCCENNISANVFMSYFLNFC